MLKYQLIAGSMSVITDALNQDCLEAISVIETKQPGIYQAICRSATMDETGSLAGLLAIVTDPVSMEKKIRALQDKIDEANSTVKLALEKNKDIELREADLLSSNKTLDKRNINLTERESSIREKEKSLSERSLQLDATEKNLLDREDQHSININELKKKEKALIEIESALNKKSDALLTDHDKRLTMVIAREKAANLKEGELAAQEADLASRINEMSKLIPSKRGA